MSEPSLYKGLSARLIKTFGMAELEARKLKYATTGTEALLMGMLTEGTSKAARFLRTKGVTLYAVKQETVKLLGKGDMYYNPPEHPPVTEPGKKALEAAHSYRKTLSGGEGEVTTEHLLLGLLDQTAATAAQVLKTLGIDDAAYEELKHLAAGQATTVA
ncbi:hypothetical protein KFL_003190010 [Klebsormidium nitens]|uniref:Clp R domain-containing protein n=1 Tax=Klebsormidium nitens TaxID=105231 RepID=A0A1Y1I7G4_KLENI|nr:hypothetical protein KFL_003190010 [Klebsormidium nitens]|eukprot:GAQ86890.1 hypothetical protein KFL_003190010 [Klebsormidium nitens]